MEQQRPLRLGDILDDYCPRERRVTNHAVVAMIEEDVKQTRCTTCDAEHVYKGGKAPRRKKRESTGALYKEVLAGIEEPVTRSAASDEGSLEAHSAEPDQMIDSDPDLPPDSTDEPEEDDSQVHMLPPDDGPVHRQLIRAQLPRPEGVKIERQAPEFTIRQNNARHAGFRGRGGFGANGGGNGQGNGNGSGQRFGRGGPHRGTGGGGGRPGQGGGGFGRNQGPRKRSR